MSHPLNYSLFPCPSVTILSPVYPSLETVTILCATYPLVEADEQPDAIQLQQLDDDGNHLRPNTND
jgi:hypothetical protein